LVRQSAEGEVGTDGEECSRWGVGEKCSVDESQVCLRRMTWGQDKDGTGGEGTGSSQERARNENVAERAVAVGLVGGVASLRAGGRPGERSRG